MSLTRLFCNTDDFCQWFTAEWEKTQIEEGSKKRLRKHSLSHSEVMTIIVFTINQAVKPSRKRRGAKSSTGWFYGFKLHLLVDDCGEILSFRITRANVDDRTPVPAMLKNFVGKVFGDRSYISKKLTELLACDEVELITTVKK